MRIIAASLFAAIIGALFPVFAWSEPDYGTELQLSWSTDPGTKLMRTNWSNDGTMIVFETVGTPKHEIQMVSAEGGTPVLLSDGSDDLFLSPRFSINDTVVLYTRFAKSSDGMLTPLVETVNIETGDRTRIEDNGFGASFDPAGKYLAFIGAPSQNNILEFTVKDMRDGSVVLQGNYGMTSDFVDCCFHPSGEWVATTFANADGYKLYKAPMNGDAPTRIVPGSTGDEWYPSISSKGTRLLYTQFIYSEDRKTFKRQAYMADIATGVATPLVPGATMETHSACFSPDGKKVCYVLETETGPKLYVLAVETETGDDGQVGVMAERPLNFSLSGNYPNPFNPSTTILFTLQSACSAHLSIYSLSGQKIRDLTSGEMTAGSHSVAWDGKDERGAAVSSGIYIVNLKSGDRSDAKKIMLLR